MFLFCSNLLSSFRQHLSTCVWVLCVYVYTHYSLYTLHSGTQKSSVFGRGYALVCYNMSGKWKRKQKSKWTKKSYPWKGDGRQRGWGRGKFETRGQRTGYIRWGKYKPRCNCTYQTWLCSWHISNYTDSSSPKANQSKPEQSKANHIVKIETLSKSSKKKK